MARIAPYAFFQELDDNGNLLDGGLLYTYEAGTTTPKVTYTDSNESTANANPVVLDASGRADIWLGTGAYKFILKTSADVLVKEVDNIVGEASNVFGATVTNVSTNTAVTEIYKNGVINCTAALTLSLIDVATAEEGFLFTVKNSSSGQVTIDPDASETINGAATFILEAGESIIVVCNGTVWITVFELPDDIIAATITADTVTADDVETTDLQALTTAGFNLKDSNGNICLSGGAGGAANLTMGGNMSGASTHKLVNMSDPTNAQDYVTKAYTDTKTNITWSSEITVLTGNNLYTYAHGLGVLPSKIYARLVCKVIDKAYAVGDVVNVNSPFIDPAIGLVATGSNATNVFFSQRAGIPLVNKDGSGYSAITYTSWKLQLGYIE